MGEEKKVPKALIDSYLWVVGGYAKDALGLTEADIEKALMVLAEKWAGCLRCAHSRAPQREVDAIAKGYLDLKRRTCALGLAQGDCGECYTPFVWGEVQGGR